MMMGYECHRTDPHNCTNHGADTPQAQGALCRVCGDDILYTGKDDPAHPNYDHDFETQGAAPLSDEELARVRDKMRLGLNNRITAQRLLATIDKLQERYDCNTAIMHARTKAMNEYREKLDKLQVQLAATKPSKSTDIDRVGFLETLGLQLHELLDGTGDGYHPHPVDVDCLRDCAKRLSQLASQAAFTPESVRRIWENHCTGLLNSAHAQDIADALNAALSAQREEPCPVCQGQCKQKGRHA